jgi:murein DD-endopeptidase MepM/ murein hydrolase activator NlpD
VKQTYERARLTFGDGPPLNFSHGNGRHIERRAINLEWLIANVLMGCAAAALLTGALYSALDRRVRFATAPIVVVPPAGVRWFVAEGGRRARLKTSKNRPAGLGTSIQIEQLDDSGSGMRNFTHLVARLGEVSEKTVLKEKPVADGNQSQRPDSDGTRISSANAPAEGPALPPEILTGRSDPALPADVSAYAPTGGLGLKLKVLGQPLNVTAVAKSVAQPHEFSRVVVARAGDTLQAILVALRASTDDAGEISSLLPDQSWFDRKALTGGERITVFEDAGDEPATAVRPLKVTVERPDSTTVAVALADSGHYAPVVPEEPETDPSEAETNLQSGGDDPQTSSGETIRESLYDVAAARRLDPSLIDELARLCANEVDLEKPVSGSDKLDLLYGTDGSGQPEPVFVELTADGQTHRYYRYTAPDDKSIDYYDARGRSITKFLLRKPVAAGRLGDGFGWRIHPVLGDRRFHKGVDYAAPYGSPIVAAGAGVVEKIDQQWGYGKYIRIRHDLGYETTYAHVSGFPRGLKVGDRVRQGVTIAYVGSTGLSTGPHIYYEVRINGHNVDPLRIKLFGGRVLTGDTLLSFSKARKRIDEVIEASMTARADR